MKKITLLIIIALTIFLTSCQKEEEKEFVIGYVSKCDYRLLQNDWNYFFCLGFPKMDPNSERIKDNYKIDKNTTYVFDAYSFNFNNIKDCYIPVLDSRGSEVNRFPVTIANLSTHKDYRKDIQNISVFFNAQKFNHHISEKDLIDLELEIISKELLVDMFNTAFENEESIPGKYFEIPSASTEEKGLLDGKKLVLKYYIDYGNIRGIYINLEATGYSLIENIENNTANEKEIALYKNIKKIETKIIELKSFNVINDFADLSDNVYDRLFEMLRYLENYGKDEDSI